jgi:hypothetical protein
MLLLRSKSMLEITNLILREITLSIPQLNDKLG